MTENNEMPSRKKFDEPLSVLVVEDSQVDIRLLESMITELDQAVSRLELTDGLSKANALLQNNQFDVAILDLNLPDSAGIDTLKNITEKYSQLPVVVNTGAFESELGLEALNCGAQDFLVKGEYNARILNKVLRYAIERKRLELELVRAKQQIEQTQSQLIQAKKMEVIGGLASGVAHEVKNPLATITYGVTWLKNHGKHDEKEKKVFDSMQEAIDRASMIITDLLDFASLKELKKVEIDPSKIIDKALLLTKYEIDKKSIKILYSYQGDVDKITVDENKIEQVLINLFLNSIASMPQGGRLALAIKKVDDKVELIIEDDGEGIEDVVLERIFDPFFTTKRAKGGVGLGLSVSKQIMDLHEGELIIKNREDNSGVRATLRFKL